MSKFLIIGDPHMRTSTPEMRVEPEFDKVCLSKLEWVLNKAVHEDCEAILCPGDFFDSPNPTFKLQVQLTRLLKEYEVPIITTIGNHDVTGKDTSNFEFSPLAVYEAMGAMIVLTDGRYVDFESPDGPIRITGYGYRESLTDKFINGKISKEFAGLEIALIHASIGNDTKEAQYSIHDLNIKGADVAVIGDIHSGWEDSIEHESGCHCVNPGCLVRLRSTEADYTPRCMVFDTLSGFKTYIVPHLPSNMCFDVTKIETRSTVRVAAINAAHERSKEIQLERPEDKVRRVGRAAEFEEGIILEVINRLP